MEIFILAGQSNMAGRGNTQNLPPGYSYVNDDGKCTNMSMHTVSVIEYIF